MLQYLVILLDNACIPFCHADNPCKDSFQMPIETLQRAIKYGMKNNLMVQYVMPHYQLSPKYYNVLESIDNIKIGYDISIYNSHRQLTEPSDKAVLRTSILDVIDNPYFVLPFIENEERLCICYTDIEKFDDRMIPRYYQSLLILSQKIIELCKSDKLHEVNILTDILKYKTMNNCGAGITNITIAPNGSFYLCPAFYYNELKGIDNETDYRRVDSTFSVGTLKDGLVIPNRNLLDIYHAPLCRTCDAYHCNRCIWLNRQLTGDINTPSHQQCVISHIERNASRELSIQLRKEGLKLRSIAEINYLDPLDNLDIWKKEKL